MFDVIVNKARLLIPQRLINLFKHLPLAVLANIFYGFPSRHLTMIGVTGTDGKTTTVSLINHVLRQAGQISGMVSTVSAKIGDEEVDTGFHVTAPDPWLLQKLLRKMVDNGIKIVVLEATSHGLDQYRLWGIHFSIGVLTNITHEHLDYHKSMENYKLSKLNLFLQSDVAVLNKDDSSYSFMVSKIKDKGKKIVSYSVKAKSDINPKTFPFKSSLVGIYNKYNCLAAVAVASQLGIDPQIIRNALQNFAGVKGRLEEIKEGQPFKVYIDFAHTPNALEQVLSYLAKQKSSSAKLIAVFGSAGLRDKEKRPMMGRISGQLADLTIITAEDPRTEDVNEICRQIATGCDEAKAKYQITPNRQEAINYAIQKAAKKNDIVVICGKGHEKSMCFGETEYPWSEHAAARKALLRPDLHQDFGRASNII